jgi:hypothetical protein
MAIEEFFIDGDILDRRDRLAAFPIQYAVNQQQRITVRQVGLDLVDV